MESLELRVMARRRSLRVPDTGCCAGHPCDGCDRCLAGDCCGADVGEAGLPLEGSWHGQHFGKVGVLDIRGDRLRCACCGQWFANLGRHVGAHNLTADAYRAMWGLNSTTALMSVALRDLRSENGERFGHRLNEREWKRPTSEQRSRWAKSREARAETRLRRGEQPRSTVGQWVPASPGTIVARRHPIAGGAA